MSTSPSGPPVNPYPKPQPQPAMDETMAETPTNAEMPAPRGDDGPATE